MHLPSCLQRKPVDLCRSWEEIEKAQVHNEKLDMIEGVLFFMLAETVIFGGFILVIYFRG